MDRIEAMKLLSEIKHYLTAGNPVWDVDEIAEACDMAIEALRNEINCVKCEHYTERETYTGIKGVCKMDTAHRGDTISRQDAIKNAHFPVIDDASYEVVRVDDILALPSADRPTGEWVWDDEDGEYFCNKCKAKQYNNINEIISGEWVYCPNCGADMRGEKHE